VRKCVALHLFERIVRVGASYCREIVAIPVVTLIARAEAEFLIPLNSLSNPIK
jgi:hypothetical protein